MNQPAQNQEWNIQACGHVCAETGAPFADGEKIFSKLYVTPDGYARADFCESGWNEKTGADAISHWQGTYHAPPAKPDDPLKKGTVETLLRQFMAKEDFSNLNIVYILAVMLERKRILAERDVQKREDGTRIRIYEHKKTGEIFTIPDPELKLNELQTVQEEVAALLGIPPKKGKEARPASQPAANDASAEGT